MTPHAKIKWKSKHDGKEPGEEEEMANSVLGLVSGNFQSQGHTISSILLAFPPTGDADVEH